MWNGNRRWKTEVERTQKEIALLLIFCCKYCELDLLQDIQASVIHSRSEHLEKYSWWLNELDSLGIRTFQKNGLGNHKEASDLTEAVKQTLYEEYLQAYSESNR